ncbi:MAG TPA: TonB-dependent receptor plug domain-containing protein [Bacteroidales bacterium]|nr:TonB-dependent receptor plug domain-containing protein [Bacteroidales bacterium]
MKPALKKQIYLIIIVFLAFSGILSAQEKAVEIDSVVIRAKAESRNLMEKPYTEPVSLTSTISRLTSADIVRTGSTNVVEALNYLPGAMIETRGRQVKQFFSIRGQKYPYPDYAINGVWQKEFEELPYFFSTSDIQEIEVVRSSAALLTGLSGLTGLVNIKTREYTSPETRLEMEYGTFNTIHTHLSNGNKIGNFSYAAGAGFDRTSGPEGKHSKEEMADLYTQLGWQPSKKLNVKAGLFVLNGTRQMRIAELPADKKYRDMVQNFDPVSSILSNVKTIYRPNDRLSTELQLFYSYRNPTFNDEVKKTSSNEKDYEYGLNFIQSVALTPLNTLRFGGLYNHWIAPNGKRFYTGKKCDTETYSAVVVDEHRIGSLTLDGGLRWTKTYMNDYGAFNIEGDGAQFKNVTPIKDEWEPAILQGSFGASYRMGNILSVYFNSAAGQVKPRQGSLDINLAEPTNESRYKFDMGLVRNFTNSGRISLSVFSVIQKDAIALSGKTYVDTALNITRELYVNRNQEQSGIEFELIGNRLEGMLQPFLNFTVMKSLMNDEGTMVENKENPKFIMAFGGFLDRNSFDLNMMAKYISAFENERFASPTAGPQPLGDFLTIDFTAGYTTKGKVPVRFYVKSRNLADQNYSTVIGYPDFGRMIFGGIQVKFAGAKD